MPIQVDCYSAERNSSLVYVGKFFIDLADFEGVTTCRNIKFSIILEGELVDKKRDIEKPASVVITIVNLQKQQECDRDKYLKEAEEHARRATNESAEREVTLEQCQRVLIEYAEDNLRSKFQSIHIELMKMTMKNNYHVIYTTDVLGFDNERMLKTIGNRADVMFVVVSDHGNIFGVHANQFAGGVADGRVFLIKGTNGVDIRTFQYHCKVLIAAESTSCVSVPGIVTVGCDALGVIHKESSTLLDFDGRLFTGKISPDRFGIQCVVAMQWY